MITKWVGELRRRFQMMGDLVQEPEEAKKQMKQLYDKIRPRRSITYQLGDMFVSALHTSKKYNIHRLENTW